MTTNKRIEAMREALALAWKEGDALRVMELQEALRKEEYRLNMEIDLKVSEMFMATRNLTKVELN